MVDFRGVEVEWDGRLITRLSLHTVFVGDTEVGLDGLIPLQFLRGGAHPVNVRGPELGVLLRALEALESRLPRGRVPLLHEAILAIRRGPVAVSPWPRFAPGWPMDPDSGYVTEEN